MLTAITSNEKGSAAPILHPTSALIYVYVRSERELLRDRRVHTFRDLTVWDNQRLRSQPTGEGISLWLQLQEFCVQLHCLKRLGGSPSVIACRTISGEWATARWGFCILLLHRRLRWCLLVKPPDGQNGIYTFDFKTREVSTLPDFDGMFKSALGPNGRYLWPCRHMRAV